ncbi:HAD family hydrolase [bacterium]|nr:MAG: HAD family hydrolase [bacterium]
MKTVLGEINLIIWDWSGVISDDRWPVYEANMDILARYDKPRISYDEWWNDLSLTLQESLETQGINLVQYEVDKVFRECYDKMFRLGIVSVIYPEVLEALEQLSHQGFKLAVVSAHPIQNLERETKMYGIRDYFDLMLGWATAHKTKSILEVCKCLAILPKNAIYVGDMIMDVRSAKKAGVHSVAIARDNNESYHSKEVLIKENPEILARNLDDLIQKLGVRV